VLEVDFELMPEKPHFCLRIVGYVIEHCHLYWECFLSRISENAAENITAIQKWA
jgi:hypothetical protein